MVEPLNGLKTPIVRSSHDLPKAQAPVSRLPEKTRPTLSSMTVDDFEERSSS
jgi:hypothetical protein